MRNYDSEIVTKLQASFLELLQQKPFDEITISSITKNAQINRTSFYVFWSDKEDLLDYLCANLITDYTDNITAFFETSSHSLQKKIIINAFKKLTILKDSITALWAINDASFSPYLRMQTAIENAIIRHYRHQLNMHIPENNLILYAKYFAACAMTTIKWWFETNSCDYEYVARVILTSSSDGFYNLLFCCN